MIKFGCDLGSFISIYENIHLVEVLHFLLILVSLKIIHTEMSKILKRKHHQKLCVVYLTTHHFNTRLHLI